MLRRVERSARQLEGWTAPPQRIGTSSIGIWIFVGFLIGLCGSVTLRIFLCPY